MRLKNVPGAREAIAESTFCIQEDRQQELKGHWQSVFPEKQPLHIEIGMGKGQFLYGMALAHPDINYLGIEKYSSVLLRAIQKMEAAPLPNLRFLRMDAEEICNVFAPGEIDRIYLNFSDPWPKDRHAKSCNVLKKQNEEAAKLDEESRKKAQALALELAKREFVFKVNAKNGNVFNSVSTKAIAEELKKNGITIDKRKIVDTKPLTTLGYNNVRVELYKDVVATIKCKLVEE